MKQAQYGGSNVNYIHAAKTPAGKATAIRADSINKQLDLGSSTIYYENNSGDESYPDYSLVPI